MVNPAGTQKDLLVINKGNSGVSWDGNWIAESFLFNKGWKTFIFIPYSDLPPSTKNEWRINFIRKDRSLSPPELYTVFIPPSGNLLDLSEAPILKMDNVFVHSKRFFLNPYVLGEILEDGNGNGIIVKKLGGNVEFKNKRKTTGIIFSLYPDFNFIEADEDHILFDEYGYYLDEKRPFFMIKQELYQNGLFRTIYTRKVDSFDYGSNIYATVSDKTEFNAFLIKRSENSDSIVNKYWDYLAILNYKRKNYNLQFNFTGETDMNSKVSTKCYDLISEIYLPFISTFIQLSKYNNKLARAIEFSRENDREGLDFGIIYKHIPYGFNPPLGYLLLPRDAHGFKQIVGNISYTKYFYSSMFHTVKPNLEFLNETEEHDKLLRRIFSGSLKLGSKSGVIEYEGAVKLSWEDKVNSADSTTYYHNFTQGGYLSLRHENGKYQISFSLNRGKYQGGRLFYPSISAYIKPIERMGISFYAAQLNQTGAPVTKLLYSRMRWRINDLTHLSTFVQWSSRYNELLFNSILQYRVNARTYLYLSLSELHRLTPEDIKNSTIGLILTGMAIKVTYKFGLI